jgi:hypothetical protein
MAGIKKMHKAKLTQVYLDEAVHEKVKQEASKRGIPMAEWIRRSVNDSLAKPMVVRHSIEPMPDQPKRNVRKARKAVSK